MLCEISAHVTLVICKEEQYQQLMLDNVSPTFQEMDNPWIIVKKLFQLSP